MSKKTYIFKIIKINLIFLCKGKWIFLRQFVKMIRADFTLAFS